MTYMIDRMKIIFAAMALFMAVTASALSPKTESYYTARIDDPSAVYFDKEHFGVAADGREDVSDKLQEALDLAHRKENGCNIVFIPEGTYRLSKTIYVPACVRIIGYGKTRPQFILTKHSPGFGLNDEPQGKGPYLFWFISGGHRPGSDRISDANSGTFYSSMHNVDIKIEDGNEHASAIRAHFAQHCSISHVKIDVGTARAGIVDAGNHIDDVTINGGDYAIDTDKSSPGWPIMIINSNFTGQRKSAILTHEGGLTIIRMTVKDTPRAVEVKEGSTDRLFMEDCILENVKETGLILSEAGNGATQINLRNIQCRQVPVFALERDAEYRVDGKGKTYLVKSLTFGYNSDSMEETPSVVRRCELEQTAGIAPLDYSDTPRIAPVENWVNVRDLGAKGDGMTDDTEVFLKAVGQYEHIYIPQGWYVVKEPLTLKENTEIIGLHPGSTILLTMGGNKAFSGFGSPVAQLTTPQGGRNIVTGIFLNADAYNYRAVNCKWMSGEGSYMYDVKFSGHDKNRFFFNGQSAANPLEQPTPVTPETNDLIFRAWDNQHWSLWITNGGGGVFRDIWTANEYSMAGLYISDTDAPGKIYGMSLEHHLRHEAILKNVSGWKLYDIQFEVEADGVDTQPLELISCRNLTMANVYSYRVSRMLKSHPCAIRTWDCENLEIMNIHNFSHARVKFTSSASVLDMNTRRELRRWEVARLLLTGNESAKYPLTGTVGVAEKMLTGFEFVDGLARDSKGNLYFCEQRMRRIYKLSGQTGKVTMIGASPYSIVALACDMDDRLIVVTKYISQPGYTNDDERREGTPLFGWRGSGGLWGFTYVPRLYCIDPDSPDNSFEELPARKMGSVEAERVCYLGSRTLTYGEFYNGKKPEMCFVAKDGKTVIPYYEDLFRCSSIAVGKPGSELYSIDEYHQRVVRSELDGSGCLTKSEVVAEGGDRCVVTDDEGNVYVTDGDVVIYNRQMEQIGKIEVPERPTSLMVMGDDLYITAITSLYKARLK